MPKIEKIKQHFKDNAKLYIGIGIGAGVTIIGAAAYVLLSEKGAKLVGVRPVQVLTYKSNQVIDIHIEALGDPGNIIQDLTTGTVYASQNQAARELGVDHRRISKHLQGLTDNVDGHKFTVLGKAAVSE